MRNGKVVVRLNQASLVHRYSTILEQQAETIDALRRDIEEAEAELEWANVLDEAVRASLLAIIQETSATWPY